MNLPDKPNTGGPVPVFEREGKWEEFLNHIKGGMTGYRAAEHMGHSWRTLNRYLKANPEARDEFMEAKRDAREAPAMRVLMEIMEDEDVDPGVRAGAADKVLRHSMKDMEQVIRHEHTVSTDLSSEEIESIASLRDILRSRGASTEIIDVESEELEPSSS